MTEKAAAPVSAEEKAKSIPTPPGWGEDKLSEFLQRVQKNQIGSFVNFRAEFELLREVDDCFVKIAENLLNPRKNILSVCCCIVLMRLTSQPAVRAWLVRCQKPSCCCGLVSNIRAMPY